MDFLVSWLANVPSFAVPYALATLGLIISERAGVLNLGAEGYLLAGALAGVGAMLTFAGHPMVALAAAALAAGALSVLFAFLVITLRVDQVISGLTIVFLAQGLTSYIATRQGWSNRVFSGMGNVDLGPLSDIPILGPVLFSQDAIVYAAILVFFVAVLVLTRTHVGLRLSAVGENPEAADAVGIPVGLYRLCAVVIGGMLAGLAGGYLAVVVSKLWVDDLSSGRGWIAVALVIFARWQPWPAFAGALIFGGIEALVPRVAAIGIQVPQYLMLSMPYLITLSVMVWANYAHKGRSAQPAALGEPFLREDRH
jgi:simple sugar transport system permease protein